MSLCLPSCDFFSRSPAVSSYQGIGCLCFIWKAGTRLGSSTLERMLGGGHAQNVMTAACEPMKSSHCPWRGLPCGGCCCPRGTGGARPPSPARAARARRGATPRLTFCRRRSRSATPSCAACTWTSLSAAAALAASTKVSHPSPLSWRARHEATWLFCDCSDGAASCVRQGRLVKDSVEEASQHPDGYQLAHVPARHVHMLAGLRLRRGVTCSQVARLHGGGEGAEP